MEGGVFVFSPQDALYEDMQMEPIRVPAFERTRGPMRALAFADFWLSRKQVRLRFLYDAVREIAPGGPYTVLDVGSGGGKHTLTRLGPVAGVDISLRALVNARKTYQVCVRQDVRQGLPFPDGRFDVVNCADVLGHFRAEERDRLLTEIRRVLRPGGWFITIIETSSDLYARRKREFPDWYPAFHEEMIRRTGHIGMEPPADAVRRIEHHGFEMVRTGYVQMGWGYTRGHLAAWTDLYPPPDLREALLRKLAALAVRTSATEFLLDDGLGILDVMTEHHRPVGDALAVMVLARATGAPSMPSRNEAAAG